MQGYSGLVLNRHETKVLGVPVTVRKHSVAFRQYSQLLAFEGRSIAQEEGPDGEKITRVLDAGTMDLYRKIVRATVADGVVSWGLKTSDGTPVGVSEEVLLDLEARFPEFLAEVFDQVEAFNQGLPPAKKKTSVWPFRRLKTMASSSPLKTPA